MTARLTLEALESLGGVEAIMQEREQFVQSCQFLEENIAALTAQYPRQWVAISNNTVLGVADTLDALLLLVPEEQRSVCVVRFLDPNPVPFNLLSNPSAVANGAFFSLD